MKKVKVYNGKYCNVTISAIEMGQQKKVFLPPVQEISRTKPDFLLLGRAVAGNLGYSELKGELTKIVQKNI